MDSADLVPADDGASEESDIGFVDVVDHCGAPWRQSAADRRITVCLPVLWSSTKPADTRCDRVRAVFFCRSVGDRGRVHERNSLDESLNAGEGLGAGRLSQCLANRVTRTVLER